MLDDSKKIALADHLREDGIKSNPSYHTQFCTAFSLCGYVGTKISSGTIASYSEYWTLFHITLSGFFFLPCMESLPDFIKCKKCTKLNMNIHCIKLSTGTAQVAQGGCGVSILRDNKKIFEHGPKQPATSGPAWAGGWTRWLPEVPYNLSHFMILWNTQWRESDQKTQFLSVSSFPFPQTFSANLKIPTEEKNQSQNPNPLQ